MDKPQAASSTSAKLSRSTLGAHNKTSAQQGSKTNFVSEWVSSQTQTEDESETDTKTKECKTPAIILSEADEECAEPTELVSAQYEQSVSSAITAQAEVPPPKLRSMSVDVTPVRQAPSKGKAGRHDRSGRRVSVYPNMLDQPIMEESTQDLDAFEDEKCDLQQQHPQKHFDICIDQPLTLSASFGAPKLRQRAKSFPSEAPMNTLPMLELPQQAKEQHTMEETQIACTQDITPQTTGIKKTPEAGPSAKGIGKFVHVALLAKKWKKRSVDGIENTEASIRESLAERQRKRPFIEVPRSLQLDLMEEAYPIVQKTYHSKLHVQRQLDYALNCFCTAAYKSYLGPRHKLTLLAEKHLEKLEMALEKS